MGGLLNNPTTFSYHLRRRWPDTIVSWSRVVGGSVSDPLVGRDVLIATVVGVIMALIIPFQNLVALHVGAAPRGLPSLDAWLGVRQMIAAGFLSRVNLAVGISLFLFFLIFLLRVLTRRRWLTAVLFVVLFTAPEALGTTDPLLLALFGILFHGITVIIFLRYGLLTMATAIFVSALLDSVPVTTDFSAWYSGYMIAVILAVLALAGWAFHTSLGGQKLFAGNLFEE